MLPYIRQIENLSACRESIAWLREQNHPSLEAAWAACQRGDWMLWLLAETVGPAGDPARVPLVLAACDCVELTLPLIPAEGRHAPLQALDTARAWTRGEATKAELRAVYDRVTDAAMPFQPLNMPAFVAARAIGAVVYLPFTILPTGFVTQYGATNPDTFARGADLVRAHFPNPPAGLE